MSPILQPGDLSIVIVNWNTLGLLRRVLETVMDTPGGRAAQTIVVDNASTDGSAEMVARDFPDVVLIRNAENRGFAAANNQGFAVATGRHVLMLNSDTEVLGDVLAASVAWLDAHPDVAAMGCRVLNPDGTTQLTCSRHPGFWNLLTQTSGLSRLGGPLFGRYQMRDWDRRGEREVEVISGCYLLVRRTVIDQIGPLDEAFFFFGEETDWCRRMRDAGWRLMFAEVGEIIHIGGASARALNHRRDVLLTDALIRLARKHDGPAVAAAVKAQLVGFNATRWLAWGALARLRPSDARRARATHFEAVTRALLTSGP